MNRCPVIYLTFKDIDGLDFDSAMAKDVKRALQQMDNRKYGKDLDGYRTVLFYGAAFFEKDVLIKTAE